MTNADCKTTPKASPPQVALITGGARRVGAAITRALHAEGYAIILHYRHSHAEAEFLAKELNQQRADSVTCLQADLDNMPQVRQLTQAALQIWGKVDLLINNASAFYPTPLQSSTQSQWDELINANLRAPYFLCAGLAETLQQHQGAIINLIDIHAQRGLPGHPIYSIAKAGLEMLTKSLAKELAPAVRVNGISPGAILWPEAEIKNEEKAAILDKTLLKRLGSPEDLAQAVCYLAQADYITGQILAVDGGKSLYSH